MCYLSGQWNLLLNLAPHQLFDHNLTRWTPSSITILLVFLIHLEVARIHSGHLCISFLHLRFSCICRNTNCEVDSVPSVHYFINRFENKDGINEWFELLLRYVSDSKLAMCTQCFCITAIGSEMSCLPDRIRNWIVWNKWITHQGLKWW